VSTFLQEFQTPSDGAACAIFKAELRITPPARSVTYTRSGDTVTFVLTCHDGEELPEEYSGVPAEAEVLAVLKNGGRTAKLLIYHQF